jgi:hypothetical protein
MRCLVNAFWLMNLATAMTMTRLFPVLLGNRLDPLGVQRLPLFPDVGPSEQGKHVADNNLQQPVFSRK